MECASIQLLASEVQRSQSPPRTIPGPGPGNNWGWRRAERALARTPIPPTLQTPGRVQEFERHESGEHESQDTDQPEAQQSRAEKDQTRRLRRGDQSAPDLSARISGGVDV